jgi:hypothetical protein
MKNLAVIAIAYCLTACVTPQRCLEKFGTDTVRVTVRDTLHLEWQSTFAGDSLTGHVQWDTLVGLDLRRYYDSSASDKLSLALWYDKNTRAINYSAQMKPDTVVVTREVPVELTAKCPPVVVVDTPALKWYEKVWKGYQFFSAFLVLGGLSIYLLLKLLKS